MIVNKSMFPVQAGFSVISQMQDRFATLQTQLGTGEKSSTLAGMGRDLPMSLSVRSRLDKIEGFSSNIDTVNLRLSFLDNTLTRFDKIESEARSSAVQGQYGTGNINMATQPGQSQARLDEVVTLLNSEVAGRYLFGGSNTDQAPLPTTDVLLDGEGGRAGFKAVVSERKAADAGADDRGRLATAHAAGSTAVSLTEDGVHPFGYKVSSVSSTSGAVSVTQPTAQTLPAGDGISVTFAPTPAAQIAAGHTVSVGLSLPDGTQTQITMKAVTAAEATGNVNEFVIGADAEATAAAFETALQGSLQELTGTTLAGASTFAASQNFFNGAGEPVLRVAGNPATATALRVGTAADTVMWYAGQSPAISAAGLGRLDVATSGDTTTLSERAPASANYGFQITGVSADTANIDTSFTAADPSTLGVAFTNVPNVGETVTLGLAQPDGTTRSVSLTAVTGKAGPGQFSIGADADATAANFSKALTGALTEAATVAQGNPRQSVSAQVDENTRTNYGLQANESGFLAMMRSFASTAVTTYPDSDSTSKGRFDAMAIRQQDALSEAHNTEPGSIEIITMDLGIARSTADNATKRHTDYKTQLDNLLSDVETVSKEEVTLEILALQTRLQASYQVTSMLSKLSLSNYL
ncbi:hypothetical protein [uncultured Devosia sp.]|uniref:hypothetical protein n=1 Tax=uncultured Devosia sp. TaxID=211434 RepID=UPI0035CC8BF2